MRNFLALLVAIVFLGGTWYYMEYVDGRGWQAVFAKAPPAEVIEQDQALPPAKPDREPEPDTAQASIEDITLIDSQGRELRCRITMYNTDSIETIRLPDGAEFTIQLDSLSSDSRKLVESLRAKFLKENSEELKENLWSEAREAIEVVVLVTEHDADTPGLKAALIQEDILFRLYDVEKSSRGRDYNEEVRISKGPAFIVGKKVIRSSNLGMLKSAIISEYQAQQREQNL